VVGPLGRDEVDAVYGRQQLQVPVLALNRGKDAPPAGSAGFSLAPEDDGIVAAEYLRGRERNRALVISSNDDTGRRSAAAFAQRFAQRGGQVVATVGVSDAVGDVGAQVRNAGQVDAVFLAVRAPQACLLAPQLALAGAGGATRVGTSQLTVGSGKVEEDVALDGIVYPNEAWNVRSVSGLPSASQVASTLPSARGAAGLSPSAPMPGRSPPIWTSCPTKAAWTVPPAPCSWTATATSCASRHGRPSMAAGRCRSSVVAERSQRGSAVEAAAEQHLQQAGLQPRARNVRCRGGELDLVMDDAGTVVFVKCAIARDQISVAAPPRWMRANAGAWRMPRSCTCRTTRRWPMRLAALMWSKPAGTAAAALAA
jgi:G:T-mismatch repair DNA endonuclease (very short patch repair protein)